LTSAGICEGFAGAAVGPGVLVFAGFTGLVAGTLAQVHPMLPVARTASIGGLSMLFAGRLLHP
jgi:hypothetical protein